MKKGKDVKDKRIWDPVLKEVTDYGEEVIRDIIVRTIREGRIKKAWKPIEIKDWIEGMKK